MSCKHCHLLLVCFLFLQEDLRLVHLKVPQALRQQVREHKQEHRPPQPILLQVLVQRWVSLYFLHLHHLLCSLDQMYQSSVHHSHSCHLVSIHIYSILKIYIDSSIRETKKKEKLNKVKKWPKSGNAMVRMGKRWVWVTFWFIAEVMWDDTIQY